MMIGLGVVIGRGTYLVGGFAKVWEISVATGRVQWVNWDPSPFTRNTSLGIFCGQVSHTVAMNELLCLENAVVGISLFFTSYEKLALVIKNK